MKQTKKSNLSLLSELLFTILPIIIIVMIRLIENNYSSIFLNSEWGIISVVLFGQSIVKFSSGLSNSTKKFRWQVVALVISGIIVLGLIPSIVYLIIILTKNIESNTVYLFQLIWFILSIITFFIVGKLGQDFLEEEENEQTTHN